MYASISTSAPASPLCPPDALVFDSYSTGYRPDVWQSVSQWADDYRVLSSKEAEPGRWRTSRTPYLREIMDGLSSNSPVQRISVMKGAQLAFTECGLNWMGYVIHRAPGTMLYVMPALDGAKRTSKRRVNPLIEDCEPIRNLVRDPRSRDSGNTILSKEFPGGEIIMTGANSAQALRSTPCRYAFLDEIDGYPLDVDGEGAPDELAIARTRTYKGRRKIYIPSTPTIKGKSRIEREFNRGDQRYYNLPCPHCGHKQRLVWERLRWEKGRPETVAYHCESCEQRILEHSKTAMLEAGEWIPTAKCHPSRRSYHLSSLYTPVGLGDSWEDIARNWEEIQGDIQAIKSFKNTVLGEPFEEEGEAPDWEKLRGKLEDYPLGTVPARGLLLFSGADVQADRVEVYTWARGRNRETWLVDVSVFPGDPRRPEVWASMDGHMLRDFPHESGAMLTVTRLAIDTRYAKTEVEAWARKYPSRVIVIAGVDGWSAPVLGIPKAVDIKQDGRRKRRGLRVWPVGTWRAKQDFYEYLGQAIPEDGEPYPANYVHISSEIDNEVLKQMTAEELRSRQYGRSVRQEWVKVRDRNEALDCAIYARAAAIQAGADQLTDEQWAQIENSLGVVTKRPLTQKAPTENQHHIRQEQAPRPASKRELSGVAAKIAARRAGRG